MAVRLSPADLILISERASFCRSQILRVFHEATSMDLAVVPIVLMADTPVVGMHDMTRKLSTPFITEPSGFTEIRCAQLDGSEFLELPVLSNGEVRMQKPRIPALLETAGTGFESVIVLSDAAEAPRETIVTALAQIAAAAVGPVTVVLTAIGGIDEEDRILSCIQEGLDLHPAHVPTARLSMSLTKPAPSQPVLLAGHVSHASSKRGERYMEIDVMEPYDHMIRFTVTAIEDQDDDALNEDLFDKVDLSKPCFVRLQNVDGDLVCHSDALTNA
jgi:hypothetical protein